jgi:DNA-binding NarL/FixJ family response regulator
MTRILLADDHEMIRRGLRNLIESRHPAWEVCSEEASNGREAMELAARLKPDVAVVDLSMPQESGTVLDPTIPLTGGLEAARQIRRLSPRTEVLIFSMYENEQFVRDVQASGAKGYVLKAKSSQHLVAAIEALAQHRPYFSGLFPKPVLVDSPAQRPPVRPRRPPKGQLTARQREIVRLLAMGMSNQEIASALTISDKTAKTHRAAIMERLGARTTVEAVMYAVRAGLVEL